MNLVGYTTTALSRNDIVDTPTNKNVVDGAIVELKDYDGNLVTIYDDINGTNPETQKTCDTNGQCTFFAEAGDYVLEVNGRPQNITISVNITVVNDVSSQRIWGDRYKGELTADVGVTLTDEFSVLLYDGNYYSYTGSDPFPVIVASGTVPDAPDYKLRNPTDHDSDINRNAVGAHDDIYIRTVTLAQAIAEDAPVGTRYFLSDRQHRFDVVSDTAPASGGGTVQISTNKVLKIVLKNGQDTSIEAFGVSDSVDSTDFIIEALNSGARLYGDESKEYLYSSATKGLIGKPVFMRNIKLSFGASFDGYILEFNNSVQQYNCEFNFNNNYYCNTSGRSPAPIAYLGKRFTEENCVYKNLLGVEDRFQYACKISSNTITESINSEYRDITGVTNSAGTVGFCGGAFISTDPYNLGVVTPSKHKFSGVRGYNIKTIANAASVRAPDSDLIRYYAYEFESAGTYPDAEYAVRKTKVTIEGQYCENVLKSGAKLSYCVATIKDSEFYVTDDDGQGIVFAPWRYQAGDNFTVKNVIAKGVNIANAVVASGAKNTVSNVTFDSDYINATAVFCGGNADSVVNVRDVYTSDCAYILQLSTAKKVTARGLYNDGYLRLHAVRYINTGDADISKVRIDSTQAGLLDSLNASSSFGEIKFHDVELESSTTAGLISQHEGGGKLKIFNSLFNGTYTRIIVGGIGISEFVASNTKFETSTTNTNQILADFNSVDVVKFINGSEIVDNRGNKTNSVIRVSGNKTLEFSGFKYTGTAAGVGITFLNATGDGSGDFKWSDSVIESVDPMGSTIVATGYRVARLSDVGIRMPNDSNGVINLTGNTASTVDGIYGNLKATEVDVEGKTEIIIEAVIGADSVINQVKIP